jgi:hypothetical protein
MAKSIAKQAGAVYNIQHMAYKIKQDFFLPQPEKSLAL